MEVIIMKKVLLTFILVLMASTALAQSTKENIHNRSRKSELSNCITKLPFDEQLEKWMEEAGKTYNVDSNFLKAVAHIESRKGGQKFRTGKISKTYYGPMGIHKCFISKWNIADPVTNIAVGANALRGVGNDPALQRKRLKRYNTSFHEAYWKAIKQAERKFARGE